MSVLWMWLGIIFNVDIGFGHARTRPRMIWRCAPIIFQQLHPTKFLEHYTPPVGRRSNRPQSALALAAVLVADHPQLSICIPAQSVGAK
jgi:hypothetical protein